ncbi:MAG: class I SAM-dependent methyltransferase, partial [Clostridia bacterium]|nr:class I SAM-dependent methyltransferase [Deltaproteobacteria bacterium]
MRRLVAMSVLAIAASCASNQNEPSAGESGIIDAETATKVNAALAGPQRPESEKTRDQFRHPLETLSFFGLRDDMTVVEFGPGGGWYTAVLGPVLAKKGRLVEPITDPTLADDTPGVKYARKLVDRMQATPDAYASVQQRYQTPGSFNLGDAGSADMVVTFRSLHGMSVEEQDQLFAAVYETLKPGGVFGVEDHRAKDGVAMD